MSRESVKVVIINTQYVETDAVSFKSVVQSLTGRDSTAPAPPVQEEKRLKPGNEAPGYRNGPGLNRGTSFKDFDSMLAELPSLDELYRIYSS